MLSMLHSTAGEARDRPVFFIHGARDGAHHPLSEEVQGVADGNDNVRLVTAYSRPRDEDVKGRDYDYEGRVTSELLAAELPDLDADYYLCGPTEFMASITSSLIELGVDPLQVHTETF